MASPKIGLIARADNSGLGTLSLEFYENLKPYIKKIIILDNGIYKSFPERFPGAKVVRRNIDKETEDWFFEDITTLLTFEVTYSNTIIHNAKKRGIKTVLMPMYECTPPFSVIGMPDVILCPSKLDFDFYKKYKDQATVVHIPVPVNRKKLKFSLKKKAYTFVHNAGHGGLVGRNGTSELLAAIPMIQSDIKVTINTQREINYSHPKVDIRVANYLNYQDLWSAGDVFVFPHKFDGLSLPIQEALSVGMPVLSTAIYPFIELMPGDWFFNAEQIIKTRVASSVTDQIDYAVVKPEVIAQKIDEFANKDITQDSFMADKIAKGLDWEVLKIKYLNIL